MTNRLACKQTLAVLISTVLLLLNSGCMVNKVTRPEVGKVPQPQQEHLVGVTTKKGDQVAFDPPGGIIREGTIQANVQQKPSRRWSSCTGVKPPIGFARSTKIRLL